MKTCAAQRHCASFGTLKRVTADLHSNKYTNTRMLNERRSGLDSLPAATGTGILFINNSVSGSSSNRKTNKKQFINDKT